MDVPTVRICWAEGLMMCNYEADTLPLLFASDEDFNLYYTTMIERHHRKARMLHNVQRQNAEARKCRMEGDYSECIHLLDEAAKARQMIFVSTDYQVTAAYEHLIWSIIHLGVLLMSDDSPLAHTLFSAAQEKLKEIRKSSAQSNTKLSVHLQPTVLHKLEVALHHNWATYWVRRNKWNAAAQYTNRAYQHWTSLVGDSDNALTAFLAVRKGVSYAKSTMNEGLDILENHAPPETPELVEQQKDDALVDGPPLADPDHENFNVQIVSIHPMQSSAQNTPTKTKPPTDDETQDSSFSLCFDSLVPQFSSPWTVSQTTQFIAAYGCAFELFHKRKYNSCRNYLLRCSLCAHRFSEKGGPKCNPYWWRAVVELYELSSVAPVKNLIPKYCIPADQRKAQDTLTSSHIMQQYVLSKLAKKKRLRGEKKLRQIYADDYDEEHPEEFEAKCRITPSELESRGMVQDTMDKSAVVSDWAEMLPLLEQRVPPGKALRVFDVGRVHTPLDVAREASRLQPRVKTPQVGAVTPAMLTDKEVLPVSAGHQKKPTSHHPLHAPPARAATTTPYLEPIERAKRNVKKEVFLSPLPASKQPRSQPIEDVDAILNDTLNDVAVLSPTSVDDDIQQLEEAQQHTQDWIQRLAQANEASGSRLKTLKALKAKEEEVLLELEKETAEKEARQMKASRQMEESVNSRKSSSAKVSLGESTPSGSKKNLVKSRFASVVQKVISNQVRFKSGYKLDVHVRNNQENIEAQFEEIHRVQSSPSIKPKISTDSDTGVVKAEKVYDFAPDIEDLEKKQNVLRSMLPSLNHKTESYRMVNKELSENENILQARRNEMERAKLRKNADKIAKKAGIVNIWQKLVKENKMKRSAAHEEADLADMIDLKSEEGIARVAALTGLLLMMVPPSETKTPGTMEPTELPPTSLE